MLRRNSSRKPNRRPLSRSKSANSIVRPSPVARLESVDPAIAQRDAHIAALVSYHRANGGNPPSMLITQSLDEKTVHRQETRQTQKRPALSSGVMSESGIHTGQEGILKREKSIRFAGPRARLKRDLAPRAQQSEIPLTDHGIEPNYGDPPGQTLKGIAQAYGKGFGFQSLTRNYLRSLRATDDTSLGREPTEDVTPADRKLRKSRSMMTSLDQVRGDYYFNNGTPKQLGQIKRSRSRYASLNRGTEREAGRQGSAPLSYPLVETDDGTLRVLSQPQKDLAVQLARQQFQDQIEQQQKHHAQNHGILSPKSSIFFRSRNKRSERTESSMGLRKSLRNSSMTSYGLSPTNSGQALIVSKSAGLRSTARKVSQSLRYKFKGLFSRPKVDDVFPNLSSNAEVSQYDHDVVGSDHEHIEIGDASVSRVTSNIPSLHAVPSSQMMKSRKGSVESFDDAEVRMDNDDKSRVTSWTNSVTNTVPSQSAATEWERQRLSVIRENGLHLSSSSLPRQLTAFTPNVKIDSDRVYEALMKRVGECNQVDIVGAASVSSSDVRNYLPRSHSTAFGDSQEVPTIRCVSSEDDVFSDNKTMDLPAASPRSTAPPQVQSTSGTQIVGDRSHGLPADKSSRGSPKSLRNRTISHRSSAFFGSPQCHTFRTTSPYRRALQEQIQQTTVDAASRSEDKYLGSMSPLVLPPRQDSAVGSERWTSKGYESSIYSTKDDVTAINPWDDIAILVEDFPKPPNVFGDDRIAPSSAPTSPRNLQRRAISTASSMEWKTKLSSQIAKLETRASHANGLGHVREHAKIESPNRPQNAVAKDDSLRNITSGSRSNSLQQTPQTPWDHSPLGLENSRPVSKQASFESPYKTSKHIALRVVPSASRHRLHESESTNLDKKPLPPLWSFNDSPNSGITYRSEPVNNPTRSHLGYAMTNPSPMNPRWHPHTGLPVSKRPSTASPSHYPTSRIEKTLGKLHLMDSRGRSREQSSSGDEPKAEALGSKRMVDVFLSSRRKGQRGSESRSTSDSSPAAFL